MKNDLEKVVQENVASSEETAAASEELASLVEEMNAIVDELNIFVEGNVQKAGYANAIQKGVSSTPVRALAER